MRTTTLLLKPKSLPVEPRAKVGDIVRLNGANAQGEDAYIIADSAPGVCFINLRTGSTWNGRHNNVEELLAQAERSSRVPVTVEVLNNVQLEISHTNL